MAGPSSEEILFIVKAQDEISATLKKIVDGMGGVKEETKKAAEGGDTLSKALGFVGDHAGKLLTVYEAIHLIKDGLAALNREEVEFARLNAVLAATGRSAEASAASVRALAEEVSSSTTASSNSVVEAFTVLSKYKSVPTEMFDSIIKGSQDLAAAFGGDMVSNVQAFGLAMENPEAGMQRLRRAGILFTASEKERVKVLMEAGKVHEAQLVILDKMKIAQGAAAAETKTAVGLQDQLAKSAEELGKAMASDLGILDASTSAMEFLNEQLKIAKLSIGELRAAWDVSVTAIGGAAASLQIGILNALDLNEAGVTVTDVLTEVGHSMDEITAATKLAHAEGISMTQAYERLGKQGVTALETMKKVADEAAKIKAKSGGAVELPEVTTEQFQKADAAIKAILSSADKYKLALSEIAKIENDPRALQQKIADYRTLYGMQLTAEQVLGIMRTQARKDAFAEREAVKDSLKAKEMLLSGSATDLTIANLRVQASHTLLRDERELLSLRTAAAEAERVVDAKLQVKDLQEQVALTKQLVKDHQADSEVLKLQQQIDKERPGAYKEQLAIQKKLTQELLDQQKILENSNTLESLDEQIAANKVMLADRRASSALLALEVQLQKESNPEVRKGVELQIQKTKELETQKRLMDATNSVRNLRDEQAALKLVLEGKEQSLELARLQVQMNEELDVGVKKEIQKQMDLIKANKDLNDTYNDMKTQAASNASAITDGLKGILNGTMSVADGFKMMQQRISEAALQAALFAPLQRNLEQMFSGGSGGGGSGGGGGLGGFFGSLFKGIFANGSAFSGGHVQAFATGGVVSSPTLFPMANGAGLMGEAGPEAVMPLKRLANGRLGVESTGQAIKNAVFAPSISINVSGGDNADEIAQKVRGEVASQLEQSHKQSMMGQNVSTKSPSQELAMGQTALSRASRRNN